MDDDDTIDQRIAAARGGDREAFDRLAARLRERLRGLILTRLGPVLRTQADVEDIAQETLLRAYRSVGRFDGADEESLFRWLGGIANHVILETARRFRRELIMGLDDALPAVVSSPSTAERRKDRFARLQAAFDGLSDDHRTVILLARIERLPLARVAEKMDRTPEAVSQLLWRALKKLKEAFGSTDSFTLPDRALEDRGPKDGADR
jgi:RNA polymerase sigma-70 factor (ECF subfamily)